MANSIRTEHDLIGEREVPADAYWGIHTLRALENFPITGIEIGEIPFLVEALAAVKQAAATANNELGLLDDEHERQRGHRESRAGTHGPRTWRLCLLAPERTRQPEPVDERRLSHGRQDRDDSRDTCAARGPGRVGEELRPQ